MEKLARKIAEIAGETGNYDDEKISVIAYGLTSIFQMILILLICSIVGIIFNFWAEVLILFSAVGILRSATGGAHSQTFGGCMVISIGMICLFAFASSIAGRYLNTEISSVVFPVIFSFCFLMTYIKAPVDNPRKPIKRPEKIKRLRTRAFVLLSVYTIACMFLFFFRFYSLAASFALGTLWQTFTLTPAGSLLIGTVDKLFLLIVSNKTK